MRFISFYFSFFYCYLLSFHFLLPEFSLLIFLHERFSRHLFQYLFLIYFNLPLVYLSIFIFFFTFLFHLAFARLFGFPWRVLLSPNANLVSFWMTFFYSVSSNSIIFYFSIFAILFSIFFFFHEKFFTIEMTFFDTRNWHVWFIFGDFVAVNTKILAE